MEMSHKLSHNRTIFSVLCTYSMFACICICVCKYASLSVHMQSVCFSLISYIGFNPLSNSWQFSKSQFKGQFLAIWLAIWVICVTNTSANVKMTAFWLDIAMEVWADTQPHDYVCVGVFLYLGSSGSFSWWSSVSWQSLHPLWARQTLKQKIMWKTAK